MNGSSGASWWGDLSKALTQPRDWLGPDTQALLGGMGKGVDPNGAAGNIGEVFKNYVQGIAARKSFNERMGGVEAFLKMLPQLLGQTKGAASELANMGTNSPWESKSWLSGR